MFLASKTFQGTVIHLATFKNQATGNKDPTKLISELILLSETGFLRWRENHPLAINLLLLLPAKILLCLQLRAGYLSDITLVDMVKPGTASKLASYPKHTLDAGQLTLHDAIFASESARTHRLEPSQIGNFLEKVYKLRMELITRHTRPNAFFEEIAAHVNASKIRAIRNEWEFVNIPDLDIITFVNNEISNITDVLQNNRIRIELLRSAAPVTRMCHIYTNKNQKESLGKQQIIDTSDMGSIRTRYAEMQTISDYECMGDTYRYGAKECGFSGLSIPKAPVKVQNITTPTRKRGLMDETSPRSIHVVKNPRILFSEGSTIEPKAVNDFVKSSNRNVSKISNKTDRDKQQNDSKKVTEFQDPVTDADIKGNDGVDVVDRFKQALGDIKQAYEQKHLNTQNLFHNLQQHVLDAPLTIIPTPDQAQIISDQVEMLTSVIKHAHLETDDLRLNLQNSIMHIMQVAFSTNLKLPVNQSDSLQQSLLMVMTNGYIKTVEKMVSQHKPFGIPTVIVGKDESYSDEYKTIMTNCNNTIGQYFESIMQELKETQRALHNLENRDSDQTRDTGKTTQELMCSSDSDQTTVSTPSPIYEQNRKNRDMSPPTVITGKKNEKIRNQRITKSRLMGYDDSEQSVPVYEERVRFTNTPNASHRQIPEWLKSNLLPTKNEHS